MTGADETSEEEPLLASIRLSPIATVISNPRLPDNPVVAANEAFCRLTGYDHSEIVGRNCRFLAGADTEPWQTEKIREAIRLQRPTLTELLNHRKDGTAFRNAVLVAPVLSPEGSLDYFIGSQVEVPDEAPSLLRRDRSTALVKSLSPRQREILGEMAGGYRNKQIAWRLKLSEKTVKMHRSLMMSKLGVGTSADAVRIAVEAGL